MVENQSKFHINPWRNFFIACFNPFVVSIVSLFYCTRKQTHRENMDGKKIIVMCCGEIYNNIVYFNS